MNQVAHIFAKDVRRHWPEIAILLAAMAVWVWVTPYTWGWMRANFSAGGEALALVGRMFLAGLSAVLISLMWWVLTSRLVQGENLVGDTQWWVTKPYEWESLLAAKALFLAAFVAAPMLIADWVLLAEANLHPVEHLLGLGLRILMLACFVLLPLAALAAVTSTFARMTLTVIGVFLALGIDAAVLGGVERSRAASRLGLAMVPVVLGVMVGAVVFQYARRRTWVTRGWLLAALGLMVAGGYLAYSPALVALEYPQRGSAPMQIELEAPPSAAVRTEENRVSLPLPVSITGLQPGYGTQLNAVRVTAETAQGRVWRSGWEALYGERYMSVHVTETTSNGPTPANPPAPEGRVMPPSSAIYVGPTRGTVELGIDRAFYDMARAEPVTLHLEFAVTELKAGNPVVLPMQNSDFAVPGLGECSPLWDRATGREYGIRCRSALRQPGLTFVQTQWTDGPCVANGGGDFSGSAWMGDVSDMPADFGLSPVSDIPAVLSNVSAPVAPGRALVVRQLCPGTPITFTPYEVAGRARIEATFEKVALPEWK